MYLQSKNLQTSNRFIKPLLFNQIKRIFCNIGVEMTPELFDEVWKLAAMRDPRDRAAVSVETFRSVLDDIQANAIQAS